MFEKLSDNLNLLMAKTRLNASELARRTGVPASTIKKIRNNNNPNPTLTTLIPLAQSFSISVSQLVGDLEMLPLHQIHTSQAASKTNKCIPLLDWEQIVNWPEVNEVQTVSAIQNEYGEHTYGVMVSDDDWNGFTKGSILIVDPAATPGHHDYVLVHKEGQAKPTLRQLIYDEGNIYFKPVINGCNVSPNSPQHRLCGVVMECRRFLKK